jgi:peptidoglycan/LPS O-acetylase OafA/YrhL
MSESPDHAAPETTTAPHAAPSGRVVSIDILRGLAILWVIVFHLYVDMTYNNDLPGLYPRFRDQVLDGRPLAALTAFGELVFGHGYLGVALFMMLSGLSLTMNAHLRGEPGILRGYWIRFRRILPVYWGGVALILGSVALVALLQMLMDGGSYEHQWFNVRIAAWSHANIMWDDVAWALSVVPWIFRDKIATVPVDSLWFVELLVQYYLIFPFALIVLRKVGPWYFALGAVALTLAGRWAYIPWSREALGSDHAARGLWSIPLFRMSEFFIGMSIGYLLACRREQMAGWVRSPFDTVGLLVLGVLCVMGGVILAPWNEQWMIVGDVWIEVGLALVIVPLLFKAPGWLERSAPARALVFLGVVSMTALIINDMMRFFASFMRFEGIAHGPPWWFFLWVVYVPVGTLLAYPLARVFGLLPDQRARARAATVAVPATRRHGKPAHADARSVSARRAAARRAR